MSDSDLLFAYSEWLDSEGVVRGAADGSDNRCHDELVAEFLAARTGR